MRLFLDANILFSAGKADGAMRALLIHLCSCRHTLVADGFVVGEAERNLGAKFPSSLKAFADLLKQIEVTRGTSPPLPPGFLPDLREADRPVLAAAARLGCQVLLTADKIHFGSFYGQTIRGVEIRSPASFAIKIVG